VIVDASLVSFWGSRLAERKGNRRREEEAETNENQRKLDQKWKNFGAIFGKK
jgi:hypothetical protein